MRQTIRARLTPVFMPVLFLAILVGWTASEATAGYGKKGTCPVKKILVEDVSLRHKKSVEDPDQILSDFIGKLEVALQKAGFTDEDIDCVVLSHLHFDHAGGLLTAYDPEEPMRLLFPNATFVVSWDAW